jgi:HD-like signal output (HDOD) protein
MPRQVAGISEALALLGNAQVRALVAASTLGTAARSVPGINLQQFWRYSLHTAKLARSLAGVVFQHPTAAYTAGLLHGLGELVIHLASPDRAQSINTLVSPLDMRRGKVEQRIFGFCYSQVSAALARRWLLPQVVVDALQYQSAPFENTAYEPLAGVIHLAAWRVRAREAQYSERELAVSFPGEVGLVLGLDIDMVLQQDPIDWTVRPDAADYMV